MRLKTLKALAVITVLTCSLATNDNLAAEGTVNTLSFCSVSNVGISCGYCFEQQMNDYLIINPSYQKGYARPCVSP